MPALIPITITGTLKNAAGVVYSRKQISFTPSQIFGGDGVTALPDTITAITAEDGTFTVTLYTVDIEDAFIRYAVVPPSGDTFNIDIAADSPTTLEALREQGSLANAELTDVLAAVATAIEVHADVIASDTVLGHVKVDGTTVTIDGDGTISAAGGGGGGGLTLGETSVTAYRGDRGKTAFDHTSLTNNPHGVTKAQVGLGSANDTSDADKPVSTLQAAADAAVLALAIQRANHTGTQSADTITDGTTNKAFTAGEKTKLGFVSVTQPVDLDDIETRVNNLDAAVVLKGTWDASAGTFPGGGTAQAGASYIVSVAGTVNGVAFAVGDRAIAITDNASTSTFAANWFKADYTDQVLSVNGQTGAVTLNTDQISEGSTNLYHTAARVRSAALTGLSLATNQAIAATDTVLQAFGYLQAQITALTTVVSSKAPLTGIGLPEVIQLAVSDETTALTTGTGKITFRMPFAMNNVTVRLSATTAPTGAPIIVDLKESGTTIFSTKPQIAISAKTSVGGAVPGVVSDNALADDAEITINIDQVGSTIAGTGLKVTIIGTRA